MRPFGIICECAPGDLEVSNSAIQIHCVHYILSSNPPISHLLLPPILSSLLPKPCLCFSFPLISRLILFVLCSYSLPPLFLWYLITSQTCFHQFLSAFSSFLHYSHTVLSYIPPFLPDLISSITPPVFSSHHPLIYSTLCHFPLLFYSSPPPTFVSFPFLRFLPYHASFLTLSHPPFLLMPSYSSPCVLQNPFIHPSIVVFCSSMLESKR